MAKLKKIFSALFAAVLVSCLVGCAAKVQPLPQQGVEQAEPAEEQPAPSAGPAATQQEERPAEATPEPEEEITVISDYEIERLSRPVSSPMGKEDTWTVFIYMCGTDLESKEKQATNNLNELFNVEFNENVNVVIQTGGTKEWHTEGIDADKLQRFHVKDGGLQLLEELPLANMGDAETLRGFLSWGVREFPAEKMALFFWNHGGGSMVGTQYDQNYGRDALTLPEMREALAGVYPEMTDKFELIGFDNCLMATLEVANILADHARYMVASEELEPAGGWDYRLWAQYLCNTPRAKGDDLGIVICDAYYDKSMDTEISGLVTQSLIDLSKIDNVLYAFNNVARSLHQTIDDPKAFAQVVRGVSKAESYGGNSEQEGYTNLVDVGDMVHKVEESAPEEAEVLLQVLRSAVLYSVQGENRSYASGLSVFYPLRAQREDREIYEKIAATPGYFDYVDELIEGKIALIESGEGLVHIAREPAISADGYYEMQITPDSMDIVQGITYGLYYDAGEALYYLGSDSDVRVDFAEGTIVDQFDGRWASIDGQPFSLYMLEETDAYNLYTIPVLLNGKGTNLRVTWTHLADGEGYYEIIGAWDGIDSYTGMSAREIKKLEPGDTLIPVFHTYDGETGKETGHVQGTPVLVTKNMELVRETLPEGEYLYGFQIEDIYGGKYETERVSFEIDGAGRLEIG